MVRQRFSQSALLRMKLTKEVLSRKGSSGGDLEGCTRVKEGKDLSTLYTADGSWKTAVVIIAPS